MKKLLSLILLLFAFQSVDAQSVVKEGGEYECICEVYIVPSARGIEDTFGYILTPFHEDDYPLRICNEDGTPVNFVNQKSLLLYMAKRGWVYTNITMEGEHWEFSRAIPRKVSISTLKKNVVNDEDIFQGLTLRPIRNQKQ